MSRRIATAAAIVALTATAASAPPAHAGIAYNDHFTTQNDAFNYDYDRAWRAAAHGAWYEAKVACRGMDREAEFLGYNTSEVWVESVWTGWDVTVEVMFRCN